LHWRAPFTVSLAVSGVAYVGVALLESRRTPARA